MAVLVAAALLHGSDEAGLKPAGSKNTSALLSDGVRGSRDVAVASVRRDNGVIALASCSSHIPSPMFMEVGAERMSFFRTPLHACCLRWHVYALRYMHGRP